jgi:hypothetical protein
MIKKKQNKRTINDQKFLLIIDFLCSLSIWSLIVFLFCFLLIIDFLCFVSIWSLIVFLLSFLLIKRKQKTKTINDQKETEHNDYQWSKGNRTKNYQWWKGHRTKRLLLIKRKQNKKTINDQKETCSLSIWPLIDFLFCFLLIIDYLFVLFPFDHW